MKCRDIVSHQCVFSSVLQEYNAVIKICHTSCINKVFLQPVSEFILSKFYSSIWLNWCISKSQLFEHLENSIQFEEFITFVASRLLLWPCIFICKLGMIFILIILLTNAVLICLLLWVSSNEWNVIFPYNSILIHWLYGYSY